MGAEQPSDEMTIGQLGHRPGLHVEVNLEGKTLGGLLVEAERWEAGVVLGSAGDGTYVAIKLDAPVGGGKPRGLFHHQSPGQDTISIDDPARVRVAELTDVHPDGVPPEIIELARAGKTLQAVKLYRALNGATFDEARAFVAKL